METRNLSNEIKQGNTNMLKKIKSQFFISKIFDYMKKNKSLEIIKINRSIQKLMKIDLNRYRECSTVIIVELVPLKNAVGKFINIKEGEEKYFHIFFNDSKIEIKKTELKEGDNVSKIKIKIDYQVTSLAQLFQCCNCIQSIRFTNFYRKNITDMSYMFYECTSLIDLDLTIFTTDNVTNMSFMFSRCMSLKKLDLSNFNTK